MARVIVKDLIDQARFSNNISSGISITRKFLIDGLSDAAVRRLYQAALLPDVPKTADPHPSIPDLVVVNVDIMPVGKDSPTKAHAIVEYGPVTKNSTTPGGPPTIEIGATSGSIETVFDANGAKMKLTATQPAFKDPRTVKEGDPLPDQFFKATVQEQNPYFLFGRRERGFDFKKVLEYQNHVNVNAWFNGAARTWLCTALRAKLNGDAYDVSYEFAYRARTWDAEGVYIDSTTGHPISNAPDKPDGKTYKVFQVYPTADFNRLNLRV